MSFRTVDVPEGKMPSKWSALAEGVRKASLEGKAIHINPPDSVSVNTYRNRVAAALRAQGVIVHTRKVGESELVIWADKK